MNAEAAAMTVAKSEETQKTDLPKNIQCFNPATGEKLGVVPVLSSQQVQEIVDKARLAQKQWAKSTFHQRRAVLGHIMDHVIAHADELCDEIVKDSGKTYENAMLGEILPICNKIKWTIANGEKYLKPESVRSGILMHKKAQIEYVPLGVVACIIPWNYPLQNIISSLVAPLMAGNSVVLKASEAVAWSTQRFQKITDEALLKEGFSPDTVKIINGFGDTGAALVRSGVQKILFIGSVNNGRRIIEGSAEHLTPVVMELGGKDPFIVCDDADMDKAVHSALGGNYINLGQNCIASERVIVFESVYDEFVSRVGKAANAMRQGVPVRGGKVDVGAVTSPLQIGVVDSLVKDAIAKGAKVIAGGEIKKIGEGTFYPPTVLTEVTQSMDIATQEAFGPVMLVFKVKGEDEAIELANCTEFGLHSSVITKDEVKGKRMAQRLEAGATCINDFGLCYLNQDLPFGGVKYSGYGRMNGRDGLRSYTNQKAVMWDRSRFSPAPVLFPVGAKDYDIGKATVGLMFGRGLKIKLVSLLKLIRFSIFNKK